VHVLEAIRRRGSTRAFLKRPVSHELIRQLIAAAGFAPSGTNIQPWHVHVVTGPARDRLCRRVVEAAATGGAQAPPYAYYPATWREPYLGRRRACGWGLYGTLGIAKSDRERMQAQQLRNFVFFDAPVGLFFTVDADMPQGTWLDYGMFLQTIMLAAEGVGLSTCPQAAWLDHHGIVRDELALPADQTLVCGMALGYRDPHSVVNRFRPERIPAEAFMVWHDGSRGQA
jgi:nitroreductase